MITPIAVHGWQESKPGVKTWGTAMTDAAAEVLAFEASNREPRRRKWKECEKGIENYG